VELKARRQRADGERDHESVVAGQGQVDDDDAQQTPPELRIAERAHAGSPRRAETLNRHPRSVKVPAERQRERGTRARGRAPQPVRHDRIFEHHVPGHVPKDSPADPDDPGIPVHEACQEPAAAYDDGDGHPMPMRMRGILP
jgi:hypothetical protein